MFDKEFVKTGKFPKELSRHLHHVFDERQSSDYGEMIEPDQQTASEILENAEHFVNSIETYLKSLGFDV